MPLDKEHYKSNVHKKFSKPVMLNLRNVSRGLLYSHSSHRMCGGKFLNWSCNFKNKKGLYYSSVCFPSPHLLIRSQQWKHLRNVWNQSIFNNKDTRMKSMLLLLIFNRFHTLFRCFQCWLWVSKFLKPDL